MACARCNDTGWRFVQSECVRRVERCDCWHERAKLTLIADSGIEPRYARCTLENFQLYANEPLQNSVIKAKRFAELFPAVEKGLILTGPTGIGKTHIAVAVLRQVVFEKRARGLFYDVPNLLRVIRSTYNPVVRTAEMDILRPVMEADILVLDDIGREKPSEWVEDTLNLIVNTRYNQRKPTIFTTNYEVMQDAESPDSLQVRLGFRMWSRLHEMCEFLEFSGVDFRLLPPNVGPEEMAALWKSRGVRRGLPSRTQGQARALLREPRDLKWPGGKAERG
jgi:DNA replication protein DnaC